MKFHLNNKLVFSVAFSLLISISFAQKELALLVHDNSKEIPIKKIEKKKEGNTQDAIPKKLTRKFKRDAARLALRMESKKEDLRYLNIVIPRDNIENIYDMLTNIYVGNEVAKSIAECNVHTFPNPSIDHLVIIFDRDIEWAAPLR
ncbi:MAG: hypothetical protein ACI8P3_003485, partial [Saprospiraceae bacterium]